MNTLQDFSQWGSNILGQASSQLAPATAGVGSSIRASVDFMKSGAKAVKSSVNGFAAQQHAFRDNRDGSERVVQDVKLIAEGGFGAVTLVRDTKTGTEYALKKICCKEGVQVASTLDAAEREATILQQLPRHDNIVQCMGYVVDQGAQGENTVKLLLELCSGGHLLDFMDKRNGKLSGREVMEPMTHVAAAVDHLHRQNPPIQHRDLKVENVLRDASGTWKLCDFGSCSTECVPAQELTKKRMMDLQDDIDKTVTMLYRPPEMADIELNVRKGYTINEQVDIWMLGCILYTLAFYRHPFQDNPTAMAICNAKYFIPNDHPMAKSPKLVGMIHWLLASSPQDRPTSSRLCELLRDLTQIKYGDLRASMPTSVQEKIKRLHDLFDARKDSDLPQDAMSLSSINKPGSQSRKAQPEPRGMQGGSGGEAIVNGAFDINFALAPSEPSPSVARGGYGGAAAQQRGAPAARPPAQSVDLLSFGSPVVAPAMPERSSTAPNVGGELNDLLDLGSAPVTTPISAATNGNVRASPPSSNFADFGFDPSSNGVPAPTTSTPSNCTGSAVANASFDFGADFADFSNVPAPVATPASPAIFHGLPASQGCSMDARAAHASNSQPASENLLDLL
mmetsp:Transcript_120081/g.339748  ORF Transcript_120081/g.339748 Transcript_120081/m.339748 type:complete len:621 (-) Transcript_120081:76-1938(-)